MRVTRLIPLVLAAILMLFIPSPSNARFAVGISVRIGPPALPVYVQPPCPGSGYIWTPGYWAYGVDGYYWVPGTWVLAPVGMLWTPGYWGWNNGVYIWNAGYWGPQVGFYGGIDYGFGYDGTGYLGGYWNHGAFYYNRAVNNVAHVRGIQHVYDRSVANHMSVHNVSFNGGPDGTRVRPTSSQQAVAHERHVSATAAQVQHERAASTNREQWASVNRGKPAIAATSKPAEFSGKGVVSARAAAPYRAESHPAARNNASRQEAQNRQAASRATTNVKPSNSRTSSSRVETPNTHTNAQANMKRPQTAQASRQRQEQEARKMAQNRPQEQKNVQQRSMQERRTLQAQARPQPQRPVRRSVRPEQRTQARPTQSAQRREGSSGPEHAERL